MLSDQCSVCGKCALKQCTRCKIVRYCGEEHQKADWPQHKKLCRPYREAEDPNLGRHLVATHNIEAKQIIFVEEPLVVGPKWYKSEGEKNGITMPCVGCYTPCHLGKHVCKKCRWPVCNASCAHEAIECSVLSLGPGPAANTDLSDYYREDALLVLKCLLLQRLNPANWNSLLEMQSHEAERHGTELYHEAEQRVVDFLLLKFLHRMGKSPVLTEYSPELLHRICGIIETNYMAIELPTGVELSGLFRKACMMEHDCQPNVYFQFDHATQKISVRAGCKIAKGEHLKISYTNILWGTQMRQHHLRMTKHFSCGCQRCVDPTEYGSNVSAMRCLGDVGKSCDGIQLPIDPLNEQSQWKCDKCPMVIDGAYITQLQSRMTDEVDMLLGSGQANVKQVELLLARMMQLLHPHHFHLFNLKHSLIQLYGREKGLELTAVSEAQLGRKLRLCEELHDVCHRLDPHSIKLAIYVGVILIEMALTFREYGRRSSNSGSEHFDKAKSCLSEATEILEKVLDSVAGKKLNDQLQNEMFLLEKMIMQLG